MTLAVWENWENIGALDAFLIAIIAIFIVFLVLGVIIFATYLFQKGVDVVETKTQIKPRKENQILNDDEDAVVAVLVATIDFYKEIGKDAYVKSIEKVD